MSHEKFEVGEVAIYVRPGKYFGTEVTITGPLQSSDGLFVSESLQGRWFYPIRGPWQPRICKSHGTLPEWLRKKRPPPQDWVKLCNLTDVPREVANV